MPADFTAVYEVRIDATGRWLDPKPDMPKGRPDPSEAQRKPIHLPKKCKGFTTGERVNVRVVGGQAWHVQRLASSEGNADPDSQDAADRARPRSDKEPGRGPRPPSKTQKTDRERRGAPGAGKSVGATPPRGPAPRPAGYFVNPYNFVPFSTAMRDQDLAEGHQDQDRWYKERYTAKLVVNLTTVTPLLTLELVSKKAGQPSIYTVRRDASGHPQIAGASVKGMLRSVFEQVTGSRLGIFQHSDRVATRAPAQGLKFAKVANHDPENSSLSFTLQGSLVPSIGGKSPNPIVSTPMSALAFGTEVYAWLQLVEHRQRRGQHPDLVYRFWREVGAPSITRPMRPLTPDTPPGHRGFNTLVKNRSGGELPLVLVRGTLHNTGKSFEKKRSERLFIDEVVEGDAELGNTPLEISKDHYEDLIDRWVAKLDSFAREAHNGVVPAAYVEERETWKELSGAQTLFLVGGASNAQLYPGMITRHVLDKRPSELLGQDLLPPMEEEQLTAAERVFGWVPPPTGSTARARKGLLRVGGVRWTGDTDTSPPEADKPCWTLGTLNSPKEQQARFYTRDSNGQPTHGRKRERGYADGDQLAGHKVYPHQKLSSEYWTLPPEGWLASDGDQHPSVQGNPLGFLAPPGAKPRVSVAIQDWVEPGTTFQFTLYMENLRGEELGALLWILSSLTDEEHFLKLGRGKPLGFGSVRVDIDRGVSTILNSESQRQRYTTLGSQATDQEVWKHLPDAFEKRLKERAPEVYRAVLAAAAGTDLPVHYPRRSPLPQVESYEWFVLNENGEKVGNRKVFPKLQALPLLAPGDDDSSEQLPTDPTQPRPRG